MGKIRKLLIITLISAMMLSVLSFAPGMNGKVYAESKTAIVQSDFKDGQMTISTAGDYYLDEDITGDITVESGIQVTIDLNGHVLSGAGTASVITNNGTLTVTDGNKTVTHYFTVGSDGLWSLNEEAEGGISYEDLKDRPSTDAVIAIRGGAITGGKKGSIIDGSAYGTGSDVAVGGAIYSAGDLTVDGVVICGNTIDNNVGGEYMGMGIFSKGENCTIKNSIICGNACMANGKNPEGGAIFSASTVSVENSSLSFNTALFAGGAIMMRNKYTLTGYYASLSMTNCSLLGNNALYGGALRLIGEEDDAEKTVFTFENCTIDRNVAVRDGGAIECKYGTLNIIGGSLSNNSCEGNGTYNCSGGAIFDASETYFKDVVVSGNSAVKGGAIYTYSQHNLSFDNVQFTKNKATGDKDNSYGGAIYARNGSQTVAQHIEMTDCVIAENSADASGGGIFLNCTAADKTSPEGEIEAEITGGKFAENTAGDKGGGLYIDACLSSTYNAVGKATLKNVEVSGNKALSGGGIGMSASAQLLMDECTVKNNQAIGTEVAGTGLGGGIYKPGNQQGITADFFEKVVLLNTEISGNTASDKGGGVFFRATEYYNSCFVKGTKISMADGTTKNVEDIVEGDVVKTLDHETGKISSAEVYLAWQSENTNKLVSFNLNFEKGNFVQCVGGHDFLEKTSRKYQTITADNAKSYVGKSFYGEDGQWHELLSVSYEEIPDSYYCIYSAKHQNAFAGGMLSVPDDVDYLLNIYELDENLKADEAQLAADIKKYGLTSYEYAKEQSDDITREWYEAAGTKYLFIAIGKGLFTEAQAINLYNTTVNSSPETVNSQFEGLKSVFQPVLSFFIPAKVYAEDAPKLADYGTGCITVGTGTTITDNKVGSNQNNVYLEESQKYDNNVTTPVESLFKVIDGSENINIGVTTSVEPTDAAAVPVSTAENSKDYSDFFTSDVSLNVYSAGLTPNEQVVIGKEVALIEETGIAYGTVQAAIDASENGQTVKMIADSTENVTIGTSSDRSKIVILDLNGKTLTSTGTLQSGIYTNAITNYATLTIKDSSAKGSGVITGGKGSSKGKGTYGGGVYNTSGTLTLTGGTITGNSASLGGGVANVGTGVFTMTGGTITGNTASDSGAGVANLENGVFIMTGGTITGNITTNKGGGVYCAATMNVSGTAKISGNTKESGSTAVTENVYLPSGKTITVGTGSSPIKYLEAGASIGVTTEATPTKDLPVAVTGDNSANYSSYFSSDNKTYIVNNTGEGNTQVVKLCVHVHTWKYEVDSDDTTGATLKATCTKCNAEETLTIVAPGSLIYDAEEKEAYIKDDKSSIGGITNLPEIKYQSKTGPSTYSAYEELPKKAGTYRAFITIGSGSDEKTAYVEYTINKKQLTISGTEVLNKTYNGNTSILYSTGTLLGIEGSDNVIVDVISSNTADKNVGTNKTVTVKFKISGDDASNYLAPVDDTSMTATISPLQLTISGSAVSVKTYDGTTDACAQAGTLSGKIEGDDVSVSVASANFEDKNASQNKDVTVSYSISGDDAQNYTAPVSDTLKATISAKQLTITGSAVSLKTYDGTTDASATAGTLSGKIEGDDVSVSVASANFNDKNTGENKDVTVSYSLSGDDAQNYTAPVSDTLKATISPLQLTVSGTTIAPKNYDGTTSASATIGSLLGKVEGDNVSVEIKSAVFVNKNVGEEVNVSVEYELTGTDAANYSIEKDDSLYAKISPKAVTVKADDKTMVLGDAVPEFTAETEGLIGNDTVVYSFNPISPTVQGVYSIVAKGESIQGNYAVSYVQGSLTVVNNRSNFKADSDDIKKVLEDYREKSEYQSKSLDVEVRTGDDVPLADKNLIDDYKPAGLKAIYIDAKLYLIITEGATVSEKDIGDENEQLIAITYKFDFSNKSNIHVYRVHDGAVSELTTSKDPVTGEYITLNKNEGTITVYAKKYSTFAFAYRAVKKTSYNNVTEEPYQVVNTGTFR